MISLLFTFLFYFGPLWLCEMWYVSQKMNPSVLSKAVNGIFYLVAVLMIVFGPFIVVRHTIIRWWLRALPIPLMIGVLLSYNMITWSVLFSLLLILFAKKKGFRLPYAIFVSTIITFLATEAWEIPIHFITIKLNPILNQVLLTWMLSLPYLVLAFPLYYESKKNCWRPPAILPFLAWLVMLMSFAVALLPTKPHNDFQHLMRIAWSVFWIAFAWGFPKQ